MKRLKTSEDGINARGLCLSDHSEKVGEGGCLEEKQMVFGTFADRNAESRRWHCDAEHRNADRLCNEVMRSWSYVKTWSDDYIHTVGCTNPPNIGPEPCIS